MPDLPCVSAIAGLTVRLGFVGYHQQFGIMGISVPRLRVLIIEFAEAATECEMLLASKFLTAKKDDTMVKKNPPDLSERCIRQRPAQIGPDNFGAQRIRQWVNSQTHGILRRLTDIDTLNGQISKNIEHLISYANLRHDNTARPTPCAALDLQIKN